MAPSIKQKRLTIVWEPLIDTTNQAYPDQVDFVMRGDGSGFNVMAHIIHDYPALGTVQIGFSILANHAGFGRANRLVFTQEAV